MAETYRVSLTKVAKEDLNRILHYLLTEYSYDTSRNAMTVIQKRLNDIAKAPEAFRIYETTNKDLVHLYRIAITKKKHKILFRFRQEQGQVIVARIAYGKMPTHLFEDFPEEE